MTMVLNKKQMTEEDIKTQYITPAITAKWNLQKLTMETQITDGRINLKGNFAFREKPKRVRPAAGHGIREDARPSVRLQLQRRRLHGA